MSDLRGKRLQDVSCREIRESLCVYPDSKFSIWRFLLEGITLSLEVFLHTRIGEVYLSIPKAIVGSVFIFLTLVLSAFGFSFSIHPDPTQIGGISLLKSFLESLFSFEWRSAYDNLVHLWISLWNPETRVDVLGPVQIMVVTFSVMVNVHLLVNFISKHRTPPRIWHPRSSGEPWFIWNPIYLLGYRFNVRVDIVKQLAEPIFCYMLAMALIEFDLLPKDWLFISAWLKVGAVLLLLRAYLENRNRKRLTLDRIANEYDSKAFSLQDQIFAKERLEDDFVEARGRVS